MSVGGPLSLRSLQLKNDGGAARHQVDRRRTAIPIAKDGGAKAQAHSSCLATRTGGNEGIEGAFRVEKAGAGVGDGDMHEGAFAGGFGGGRFGFLGGRT